MTYRQRAVKIFGVIKEGGKQSIRKIAKAAGLAKSSADRHLKGVQKRNGHPESPLWETICPAQSRVRLRF